MQKIKHIRRQWNTLPTYIKTNFPIFDQRGRHSNMPGPEKGSTDTDYITGIGTKCHHQNKWRLFIVCPTKFVWMRNCDITTRTINSKEHIWACLPAAKGKELVFQWGGKKASSITWSDFFFSWIWSKRASKFGKEMKSENNNLFNSSRVFTHL